MNGSQLDPADKDTISAASSKSEPTVIVDMEARVNSMWEQMNAGPSSKVSRPSPTNKRGFSTMTTTSQQPSDNWIKYLGLVEKENGSSAKVSSQHGSMELQNDGSNKDKKIVVLWEQMNKGMCKKMLKPPFQEKPTAVDKTSTKPDNWKTYLGMDRKEKETDSSEHDIVQKEPSTVDNGANDEARKLAAAALSAVKDAATVAAAALNRGKIEITEVRDFAGQEIEYKMLVDAESKDAAEKAKASTPSAVDAVLEQIKKKQKLSVLDKTKKDWGEFKEKDENKGLDEELDVYKKSSNQYLDRVSFLQRTDYREFERERDARLALQARRRADMREDP